MANQIIPQRSEVPEEYTWNLKDLYESDQAWNEEYKALKALPEQITAFRGTLGRTAEGVVLEKGMEPRTCWHGSGSRIRWRSG